MKKNITTLLFALAVAFAAAKHSHESVVPETEYLTAFHSDGIAKVDHQISAISADVSQRMTELTSSGKNPQECFTAAKAAIDSVIQEARNTQKLLDKLENGKKCVTKDQSKIDAAKVQVARKKKALRKAELDLSKARNVKVTGVYKDFVGGCGNNFFKGGEWKKAKANVTKKSNALIRAKQALKDAKAGEVRTIQQAKDTRKKCRCHVRKTTKKELDAAKKFTHERKRTIAREETVMCLIKARGVKNRKASNTATDKCKKVKISSKFEKRLALRQTKLYKGVAETNCLTAPSLTVNLGRANGSPSGSYTFMRLPVPKSWNTKNTPDFGMRTVVECGKHGMQPVCDNPSYCKPNTYCNNCHSFKWTYGAISRAKCLKRCKAGKLALYIGQQGHLGYPPSWKSSNRNIPGWQKIKSFFQKDRTCYFIYPKITYEHCKNGGSHAGWTPNAKTRMGFMCGKRN